MTPEIRFLLQQALLRIDELTPSCRATLYEGVAQVVNGPAAEEARKLAFLNQETASQQERLQATLFT